MKFVFVIVLSFLVLATQSLADQRYSITKLSDGTLRLDHQTGAVSYCHEKEGKLICSLAADERQAWISETEELSKRIERLEARLKILETSSKDAEPNATDKSTTNEKSTTDQAMTFIEGTVRRFYKVFEDLTAEQK